METTNMIPNLQPTEPNRADETHEGDHPGRGGSAIEAGPGGQGASREPAENSQQRASFEHGESELAAVTGLQQKALQKIRQKKLRQGEHWDQVSLRVAYCPAGVVAVLEIATSSKVTEGKIAGVALTELLAKTAINSGAQGTARPTEKVVGKICRLFPNPFLVEIQLTDRKVLIKVKTNKNLKHGMEVPLKAGKGPNGLELARRLPRFPGKW